MLMAIIMSINGSSWLALTLAFFIILSILAVVYLLYTRSHFTSYNSLVAAFRLDYLSSLLLLRWVWSVT
jgi:hypothetical protein